MNEEHATLLRPGEGRRAWETGPTSQGLPRDLVRRATSRFRTMALLYAVVYFFAAFFPMLIFADGRAVLRGSVAHCSQADSP